MKNLIKGLICIPYYLFYFFKIDNNKIILGESQNMGLSGNVGEIYKRLRNYNFKFIYIGMYEDNNINIDNKILKKYSIFNPIALYHLATAKYWLSDSTFFSFLKNKKEQKNIQLWHAAGAFKKFGLSIEKNKKYYIDLAVISSDKVIDFYQEAFGIEKEKIKNLGIPRADIFFKEDEKLKVKEIFFNKYPELKNKKIIMYAPTFRDNDKGNFKLKLDVNLMKEKLEKLGYVLFLRLHPSIKKDDISVDNIFSYDFSKYEQVSDLLIVSDILISDYSSIIFEFSIMKKPILFYSYDVEEYIKDRGFYYNYYEFIPNKINYTTEEVINSIINKEWDLERIEEFARYFFNPFDGNSTERVLKEVGLWEEEK